MPNSLTTGVTGLVVHQRMLDVVANNLANLNTVGYKQRQVLFADLFYDGVGATEVGSGARVAQVRRSLEQGNLDPTGESLDLAIRGQGYFIANDGTSNFYTRDGAFALDQNGFLVDPKSGYRIQRWGTTGETDGVNPGFQTPGDNSIHIPLGTALPGSPTATINVSGNLHLTARVRSTEVVASSAPLQEAAAPATTATLLNDLDGNTVDYGPGDSITIDGTDTNDAPVSVTFPVDGTTTVGQLLTAISSAFGGATASLDANGDILLSSDTAGDVDLDLNLSDTVGNTGATTFPGFATSVPGAAGDIIETTVEVFDVRGDSHTVALAFEHISSNTWELQASLDPADGSISGLSRLTIVFNDNGSIRSVNGDADGQVDLTLNFPSITAPQTVSLALGSTGTFQGVTHLAAEASLAAAQDGFSPGTLTDVALSNDGTIYGIASNGRQFGIASLALASFRNEQGLSSHGDNYFTESPSSGNVQIGTALSGGRGSVLSGQLEASNVDIALEFTRLIVAQRGFSANARTITVSSEVLAELTNVIR